MTKSSRRAKGDGALYQRSRDGAWCAVVDLGIGGDGKRRRKTVTSQDYRAAARKLRDLRRALEDHGDLPTAGMSVEKWLAHWLENIAAPRNKPRTVQGYRTTVTQHLIPHLGRRRLDKLAPQHVRDLHRALEDAGLAPGTILKAHRVLGKALTDAEREGLVFKNVASLVDAPRKGGSTRAPLVVDQARKLFQLVLSDKELGARWAMALLAGPRQGEALGLEWDRIEFSTGVIDVSWQLQRLGFVHGCGDTCGRARAGWCPQRRLDVPHGFEYRAIEGSALVLTRPKNNRANVVPMSVMLANMLMAAWERAGRPESGLVWTTGGKPIDPRRDWQAWKDLLAAAGLPPLPLHSARHTTATLLDALGVSEHTVQQIMGHSSAIVTRGYTHIDLTQRRAAVESLSGLLELTEAPAALEA